MQNLDRNQLLDSPTSSHLKVKFDIAIATCLLQNWNWHSLELLHLWPFKHEMLHCGKCGIGGLVSAVSWCESHSISSKHRTFFRDDYTLPTAESYLLWILEGVDDPSFGEMPTKNTHDTSLTTSIYIYIYFFFFNTKRFVCKYIGGNYGFP